MIRILVTAAFAAWAGIAGITFSTAATAAETTLKAIFALPVTHNLNKPFNKMIDEVNETGKGVLQIKIIGGPEATPVQEQLGALQKRIVDVYLGPTSYFVGDIPETKAMNASNRSAMDLRANGGLAMLNKAFNKRANAEYLGYFGSGYTFHIYMTMDPKMTSMGGVDFKGLKIRGTAPYRPFYDRMGITMINLHVPEMYTAFERGVVDGFWLGDDRGHHERLGKIHQAPGLPSLLAGRHGRHDESGRLEGSFSPSARFAQQGGDQARARDPPFLQEPRRRRGRKDARRRHEGHPLERNGSKSVHIGRV